MPSPEQDRRALADALDRLRDASEAASRGTAFTCGPPWFSTGDGVLIGSPDRHAGRIIADTDTSGFDDDHDGSDDDANATFITEAWNFARLILSRPDFLDALRSPAAPSGGEAAMREAAANCAAGWRLPVLAGSLGEIELDVARRTAAGIEAAILGLPLTALQPEEASRGR